MKPYLIALDLDGTLLMSDMTIGSRTRQLLQQLQQQGHAITIATGRILKLAANVPSDLGFPTHVIACNGAIVQHADGTCIAAHSYSPSQRRALEDVLEHIEASLKPNQPWGLYYHYYSEDTIYASALVHTAQRFKAVSDQRAPEERVNIHILGGEADTTAVAGKVEGYQPPNVYKYGIYRDGSYDFKAARAALDTLQGFATMFSAPNLLDIMLEGVTKWSGIAELAQHLDIPPERIMVFGDNENDLEMLQKAGISVAMGNAEPEIKNVARHVTDSNDQEGIYTFLTKYFNLETP